MHPPLIRRWQSPHSWVGRPFGPPIAFVVHTESGGQSGTVAELANSSAQFSSHYSAGLDGSLNCYVDVSDRAWSNGILEPGNGWFVIARDCQVDPVLNPNHITVTCETEDGGDPSGHVTDAQFNAVLYAGWEARMHYPDSLRYLACHADISPQSRAECPGDRWVASGRFQALALALGLKTLSEY
ncbi:MAG TPA: N-acetylmuramoyl-L-alanine amidase [Chloroflexota bacterium]